MPLPVTDSLDPRLQYSVHLLTGNAILHSDCIIVFCCCCCCCFLLLLFFCKGEGFDSFLSLLLSIFFTTSQTTICFGELWVSVRLWSAWLPQNVQHIHVKIVLFMLIDWFDWFVDWLFDSLIGWFVDWLIDSLICWFVDWLIDLLIGWFVDWLFDWLIEFIY